MPFNYEKVEGLINEELGEKTTIYISNFKDYKFEGTLDEFMPWSFEKMYDNWTRKIKEDGKLSNQCSPRRLRSLGDMYKLCQHYFPGVTLQEVREALLCSQFYTHYCSTVHKRVFRVSAFQQRVRDSSFHRMDEFGEMTTEAEIEQIRAKHLNLK